jgi:hypothetical protein
MLARGLFAVAVSVGVALCPAAAARVESNSGYAKSQAFNGALRFLRVDRGYDVVEKDADAAYVMFRYPMPGKQPSTSGSVEVVETPEGGTKIYVQLPRLPEYHEVVLRDALLKRLREDYGTPPPPKAKPPAEEAPKKPAEPKPGEPAAPPS